MECVAAMLTAAGSMTIGSMREDMTRDNSSALLQHFPPAAPTTWRGMAGAIEVIETGTVLRRAGARAGERRETIRQGGRGRGGRIGDDPDLRAVRQGEASGRGTTYYNLQFNLVDLSRRQIVWTGDYEVRVSRD